MKTVWRIYSYERTAIWHANCASKTTNSSYGKSNSFTYFSVSLRYGSSFTPTHFLLPRNHITSYVSVYLKDVAYSRWYTCTIKILAESALESISWLTIVFLSSTFSLYIIVYFLIIFSVVADTTDKFQESLLETEVLNSNTDDGYILLQFFFIPFTMEMFLFFTEELYYLYQKTQKKKKPNVVLFSAKIPPEELVQLYVACIKFVLFFGCQVFLFRLPQY